MPNVWIAVFLIWTTHGIADARVQKYETLELCETAEQAFRAENQTDPAPCAEISHKTWEYLYHNSWRVSWIKSEGI